MPLTALERYSLAQFAPWRNRIKQAMVDKAVGIAGEVAGGLNSSRRRLAAKVLSDPDALQDEFCHLVASNATIIGKASNADLNVVNTSITDTEVATILETYWNGFAEGVAG